MNNKRNTFIYLKSNSSVFNEDTQFYRFDFVNPIVAKKGELINVRATEIEVPISYYNITSNNNLFQIKITLADAETGEFTKTISEGNYNANTLLTELNTTANITVSSSEFSITITYNSLSGKYTFAIARVSGATVNISSIEPFSGSETNYMNNVLGLSDTSITSVNATSKSFTSANVCDLNFTNNIYLETDLLLESRNTLGEKSGILAKIQMNGSPFDIIHYQNNTNEDITLYKKDIYLDHINLRLVGDLQKHNINFNGAEWTLTLLFSFTKKDKLELGDEILSDDINNTVHTIGIDDDEEDCYYSDSSI